MVLLKDIILILFFAVLIILILSKFKIPPVIGFLITGVIIGPSALKLVDSVSEIEIMAEIGVILLMFSIGLEFSIDKIRKMLKDFILFGGLQVVTGWIVFFFLLDWYGLILYQSVLGGFILALSSTAIVLKLLQDNDELNSPHGLKMTGILLFQDAVIIPAMILLPFINQLRDAQPVPVITNILIAFGGVIVIFFASKIILPKVFSIILKLRVQDMMTVMVFVFLFGVALISHELGISFAMGAFIAGIAISDTEYAHQINTEIIPSRHIFNSIFFISIGMFVNVSFFLMHVTDVLVITLIIIMVKVILIIALFLISRNPLKTGILTAFGLAHIGEFSFILLRIAQDHMLFDTEIHQILLSSAILSMFTIPFAMKIGKKFSGLKMLKKEIAPSAQPQQLSNHTIIAGYGVNGQNISRILKSLDISYSIIEMNSTTVKKYKSLGEPIHFGSIDRKVNMTTLGVSNASLMVIAINDMDAAARAVTMARSLNPSLQIIVRVNFFAQVDRLYDLGANLVLSQDMETSLTFIHHILKFYNLPDHVSRNQINQLRTEHYRFFLKEDSREVWKIASLGAIEEDSDLFFISPYSKHVAKKISDLEPSGYDEMEIIGVIRHNKLVTQSLSELRIKKFDSILFSGKHRQVFEAIHWMEENN